MPGSTAGPARRARSASSTPAPGCARGCSRSTCRQMAYPLIDEFSAAIRSDLAGDAPRMSALPPAFTGQPLDRADPLRSDPARLAELRGDARCCCCSTGSRPRSTSEGRLQWVPLAGAADGRRAACSSACSAGARVFGAVPAQGDKRPGVHPPQDLGGGRRARGRRPRDLRQRAQRARLACAAPLLRAVRPCADPPPRAAGSAIARACGAQHFPRVDPVAIMLVECDGTAPAGPLGALSAAALLGARRVRRAGREHRATPSRARCSRKPACACATCATSPASRGRSRRS